MSKKTSKYNKFMDEIGLGGASGGVFSEDTPEILEWIITIPLLLFLLIILIEGIILTGVVIIDIYF